MRRLTVTELADIVGGEVEGDASLVLTGVARLGSAGPEQLSFVTGDKYRLAAEDSRAGAVLLPPGIALSRDVTVVRVDDPQLAFTLALRHFHPEPARRSGVAGTAAIGRGVTLGSGVEIGEYAILRDGASIGDRCRVGPFTIVAEGARIGEDCRIAHGCSVLQGARLGDRVQLHPGVRVGTDGFGYATGPAGAVKVPQVGGCRIGDDVEIGANSTIDRGALGDTVIGARTKIDNLVHIGHNVEIGEDCMIVAQVGVAGSVKIGSGAALAGQAGIAGHLEIGAGARIAAQAGVIGDVPAGASYSGYPARPHREAMRASAASFRLPRVIARIARLERHLGLSEPGSTRRQPGGEDASETDDDGS